MDIEKLRLDSVSAVALTNSFDLRVIPADKLRAESGFSGLVALPNQIILGNPVPASLQAVFQPGRIEFLSGDGSNFESGALRDSIAKTVKCIETAPVGITATGTNYFARFSVKGIKNSAQFIRDKFLSGHEMIAKAVGSPIISAATRIVLGTPEHYKDIKIHPLDLSGEDFGAHFHVHADATMTIAELSSHFAKRFETELHDFGEVLSKL